MSKLNPVRPAGQLAQLQGQRVPSQGIAPSIAAKIVLQRRKKGSDWLEHVFEMGVASNRSFVASFVEIFI